MVSEGCGGSPGGLGTRSGCGWAGPVVESELWSPVFVLE